MTLLPLPGAPDLDATVLAQLAHAVASKGPQYRPRTRHKQGGAPLYTNRLVLETSPYLQQHAHNPMAWQPWSDAAFEEARRRDVPVLVSVGYSTCHWCHVMEEESFEDEEVAAFANAHFVCIKIDREEHPDVDAIYMTATQAMTGHGGWPMNVVVTPDRMPFFAGTYFPPRDGERGQRMGFLTILQRLSHAWTNERAHVMTSSQEIGRELAAASKPEASRDLPERSVVDTAVSFVSRRFDRVHGGLSPAPKFPSSTPLRLLLRHHARTQDAASLQMVVRTLERMASGGIYDHVGGGFARYSTDERWLVPHFEKMLYDNALLVLAYIEAHQVTGRTDFADVARDVLGWVSREMTSSQGAFYSATDADSIGAHGEREEGAYFTWTPDELVAELGADDAKLIGLALDVTAHGNFEGRSILWHKTSLNDVARDHNVDVHDLEAAWQRARPKLLVARDERPRPILDDKVLASWNGLMIEAFARAGFALGDAKLIACAERAATFVTTTMTRSDGRLSRVHKDGQSKLVGTLDDHAFVIAGLLALFQATGRVHWLQEAQALEHVLAAHHEDPVDGGFFFVPDDADAFLVRDKPDHDGALPSGNSVHALNLMQLAQLSDDATLQGRALRTIRAFGKRLQAQPFAMTEMLLAVERMHTTQRELLVVHDDDESLLEPVRRAFLPNVVVVPVHTRDLEAVAAVVPLARDRGLVHGKAAAYLCTERACELPVTDAAVLATLMAAARA